MSLRQAYESAHKRCVNAIEAYCGILIEGSSRYLEYSGRLATLKNERIDQFLVNAVEVASSSRSWRSSRTQRSNVQSDVSAGGNSKVPVESVASKGVIDGWSEVRIKELRLVKARREAQLKARQMQLDFERSILEAEQELEEVKIMARAQSGCNVVSMLEVDEQPMSSRDRVVHFINGCERLGSSEESSAHGDTGGIDWNCSEIGRPMLERKEIDRANVLSADGPE